MHKFEKIDLSVIMIILIFASAMLGLSIVNDFEYVKSYSETPKSELTNPSENPSNDQFVKTFNEIDATLMSFFDDLRDYLI